MVWVRASCEVEGTNVSSSKSGGQDREVLGREGLSRSCLKDEWDARTVVLRGGERRCRESSDSVQTGSLYPGAGDPVTYTTWYCPVKKGRKRPNQIREQDSGFLLHYHCKYLDLPGPRC